jgi:hypothetical protein
MTTELAQIRNIGMIAHINAGKTTTTARMLFDSGYTHALGEVDEGTTVTDWWAQERERSITIKAAAITTRWRDTVTDAEAQINLIDTPGHIDGVVQAMTASGIGPPPPSPSVPSPADAAALRWNWIMTPRPATHERFLGARWPLLFA